MSSVGYAMAEENTYKVESDHRKMKTIKKPGFLKRWLLKSVKEAVDAERVATQASIPDSIAISKSRGLQAGLPSIDQPERAIQFTVYNASGGRVIETRRYDRKTDRHSNNLYVITGEQDFGREIDKIITMEALK